jgi:hypothetical protein
MPKYTVFQTRTYGFYQIVEAGSVEEAIQLAEEGEWEQDTNDIEEKVTAQEGEWE